MQNVINSRTRADAIAHARQSLAYYPQRRAWIVAQMSGTYGVFTGRTDATAKRLTREGYQPEEVKRGAP